MTGAAGQIGYSLFRIASGGLFGLDQPVILHMIEIEPVITCPRRRLYGAFDDCAFPLLKGTVATANLNEGFNGVNWALLVGSTLKSRDGEKGSSWGINGKIFTGQGQAIQKNAASDIRTLVVGNPCNTNCLIAMNNAKDIPSDRWFAMTRLDENRAKSQLAQKAGVDVTEVQSMTIWGNHFGYPIPRFHKCHHRGKKATGGHYQ